MKYWLMKSEPDVFGIKDLMRLKRSAWDGVRNYQARNFLREMKLGDLALIYHSNAEPPGLAGIARITREAHPDPTQFDKKSPYHDPKSPPADPRWSMVEVEFVEEFSELVALESLKKEKSLEKMPLVQRGTRLSVMPVSPEEWNKIMMLAKGKK